MLIKIFGYIVNFNYIERNIRKRGATEKKSKGKRKTIRKREHEEGRRERTMKLRQFYEFFSLLFDQKLFTPFSQFLSDESLKELKDVLKKRIKKRDPSLKKESSIGNY